MAVGLRGTHTPWGTSDSQEAIAPGITFYGTPSHGGFKLSPDLIEEVQDYMRDPSGWYEEDVNWAIVATVFPDAFSEEQRERAKDTLRDWKPNAYEQYYREEIPEGASHVKDEHLFREEHKKDFIVRAAWGDWHAAVPKGMVGVFAGREGRTATGAYPKDVAYFLVPKEEYDQRSPFGFVVDPKRHKKIKAIA